MQRNAYERAPPEPDASPLFLRMPTVLRLTGLGRSTIYRLIADNKFPCPVRLGPRGGAGGRAHQDGGCGGPATITPLKTPGGHTRR